MKYRKVGFRVIPPFNRVEGIEVAGGGDIWATTTRMMKMGEMGRKRDSVTSTASSYSFIYTIFVLGASHMGL
jgi:hypothetical protein